MKYYIYGGAFNPPTIAHQRIIEELTTYALTQNAKVILLPSGNRTDKTIYTDTETRLSYLDALIQDVPRGREIISIDTMELNRGHETETYETVQEMNGQYSNDELVWVFGSDSFNSIMSWNQGGWLLENVQMLIIERDGYPVNPELFTNQEKIVVNGLVSTSSTELRGFISDGKDYRHIVGNNVFKVLHMLT